MTLNDIITSIQQNGTTWAVVFVLLTSLIEFAPIKLNPWSFICNKLGSAFNKGTIEKIDKLEGKIDNLENKLNDHIAESVAREISSIRTRILRFGGEVMGGKPKSKEEFEFIINECDKYEIYCKENNILNGVAEESIKEIHRAYAKHLRENSFLKPGDE